MMLEMCWDIGMGNSNSIFCLRAMFAHPLGSSADFYIWGGERRKSKCGYHSSSVNLEHMRMRNRVLSNQ